MYFSVRTSEAGLIREHGVRLRSGPITIRHAAGEGFYYSPAVSKRYGSAPTRNRVKRIIREVMRGCENEFPVGRYLVYFNASCEGVGWRDIEPHIRSLLAKMKTGMTT
jgi:ribonuclease P protein component